MFDTDIDAMIVNAAKKIGLPESNEWLYMVQTMYWRGIKQYADNGRIDELKRFCPGMGADLVDALKNAKGAEIDRLCFEEFCAMRPVLPEETLVALLTKSGSNTKAALQMMSEMSKQ